MMDGNVRQASGTRGTWRALMWGGMAIVLALPALAMSLGAEGVYWTLSDFVIVGALLVIVGLTVEGLVRYVRNRRARRIAIGAVAAMLVLVWAELAVGLFGTPFAGN